MARIPTAVQEPETLAGLALAIQKTRDWFNRRVGLGDAGVQTIGANGERGNVEINYAKVVLTAAAQLAAGGSSPITVAHNLGIVPVGGSGQTTEDELNVIWWPVRIVHRGDAGSTAVAAGPGLTLLVLYNKGDTINTNDIQLRFFTDLALAGADNLEVEVTLAFAASSP